MDGADAFAAAVEQDKQTRVRVDPARSAVSLSVWAGEWLERRVIGEATRCNYEGFVRNHLVPSLGRKPLAGLARRDFERFVQDIYRGGAGLAASTVNDRMVMVAAIMEAAVVDKRITENPARGIRVSRRDAVAVDEDAVPTPAEVDLIAAHITPQFRLAVYLQSGTGQRPARPWPSPPSAGGLASSGSDGRSVARRTARTARHPSSPSSIGWRRSAETFPPPCSSSRRLMLISAGGSRCPWFLPGRRVIGFDLRASSLRVSLAPG